MDSFMLFICEYVAGGKYKSLDEAGRKDGMFQRRMETPKIARTVAI
jgi:hypothetical protein